MIQAISDFFRGFGQDDARPEALPENSVHLLSAVLMCEVMMSDGGIAATEQDAIKTILRKSFSLPEEDVRELINLAARKTDDATSLYEFTHRINTFFTPEQKFQLIEHLWSVAYADNEVDKFEEATIRQVAELIYVPHSEFIRAKISARP